MTPISTRCGFLTVTDLNDFNGPAQTTNLGVRSSNLFGRAKFRPFRIKLRTPRLRRRHRPSRVSGSNRKAKITAGWPSLQFDPYAAQRLPARRQHHRRTLIDRPCDRPMNADSVGSERVQTPPTTAFLHDGGLPMTFQLSHRSELGSGKRAVRKWCPR